MGAKVVSNSYGGGEGGSQNYESAYNHAGIAILASSGDSGYGVQFPASSPNVIAVGGTSLSLCFEQPWLVRDRMDRRWQRL